MLVLALLQIAALIPTGNPYWPFDAYPANTPAQCYFSCASFKATAGYPTDIPPVGMAISATHIVTSFGARIKGIST